MVNKLSFACLIIFYISIGVFSKIFEATSYWLGSVPIVLFSTFLGVIFFNIIKIDIKWVIRIFIFTCLIILQYILSVFVYGLEAIERSFFSFCFLLLLAFFVPIIYLIIMKTPDVFISKTVKIIAFILVFIGFLSKYLETKQIIGYKNVMIMPEPSHYALILLPFIIYLYISNQFSKKIFLFFIMTLLSLILENATLMIGNIFFFLITSLYGNLGKKKVIFFVLSFGILVLILSQFDYYAERLIVSKGIENLNVSSLAYFSGWERAFLTIKESFLIGAGFNRMGIVTPIGQYQEVIALLNLSELNLKDGTTCGSKLIAELGIMGIFMILIYLVLLHKIYKRYLRKSIFEKEKLFISFLSIPIIEIFVRGVGYFSPNLLLFLTSLYWIRRTFNDKFNIHN